MMNMRGLGDLNNAGGGGGGAAGGQGGGGCADCLKGIWNMTPGWTRFLFISCISLYGLSWLSDYVLYYLFCSPALIIYKLQIWRLFTGLFVHPQLLTLLFALLSHLPHASVAERQIGTVRYFFRFWMLGLMTLILFTLVCGVASLNQISIGLWPMMFCDLVIECMAMPEMEQGLCCLPVRIKRKWYPLILICIFSLFFFQLSMWFGLAMGYAYHYGFFAKIDMGVGKATELEKKWPFKLLVEKSYFVGAGAAAGGEVLNAGGSMFGMMGGAASGGGNTASEQQAADEESKGAPATNSANANFKSFSGKGTSIGGAPIAPPLANTGASASRGRSTPATRAASAASSGSTAASSSGGASGARQGSALIAKLEEKKKIEAAGATSALTETDVGEAMDPQENDEIRKGEDKEDADYAKINMSEESI